MCHSKILHFLVTAGIVVFSTSIFATVHDFGNLQPFSPKYVSLDSDTNVLAAKYPNDFLFNSIALEDSNFAHNDKGLGIAREHDVDSMGIYFKQKGQDKHFDNLPLATTVTAGPDTVATESHDNPVTSITPSVTNVTTPVPEPETYALILAGLALIAFTVRRTNRNA